MYTISITATNNIGHPVIRETNLTRRQIADRMQAVRAMTKHDPLTYIVTIYHDSTTCGNYWFSYMVHEGAEDKTLVPPLYRVIKR